MAFARTPEYHYDTAPTPLPMTIPRYTPYHQHLQSRGSWQPGDYYSMGHDAESWMMMPDDQLIDEDQRHFLQTRQTERGGGGEGGQVVDGERQAVTALASWKMEKIGHRPSISRLNLSTRGSTADLKDFLHSRGKTKIAGLHLAAAKSDVNTITSIITREGPNVRINQLDENECSPLMYAVLADSIPAIEVLLHCGAKREEVDSMGRTAVHYAAFFGKAKALRFLIESAAHWMPRDAYGRTPLHWSTMSKDPKCLQVLIKHSIVVMGSIDVRDYEGMSPLHCAAQYCKPKHVQVLYEADCDFSITDIDGKTALHWTVDNPDPSCIEALISCFPSLLNVKDANGQTILHLTAKLGAIHLVEILLTYEGIDIDVKDNDEQTPLHVAAMAGQPGPIQLLLLHNALDSCIDRVGLTALHHAVLANSSHCVQQLVLHSASVTHIPSADDRSKTPLMMAASNGHSDLINLLVINDEIRQLIDNTDPHGQSALHLACEVGASDCVTALVNHGADPNLFDKATQTPLILACDNGNANCIGPLVEGGADILLANEDGHSCLHIAILKGHTEAVEQLILYGAAVESLDNVGNTALQLAISLNSEGMVAILLDKGANPNALSMDGLTGLHLAAREGYIEILKVLLTREAFVNNMDGTDNKYTPLDYAEQNNHDDCTNLLIEQGGVTVLTIKKIAATCIQTVYRSYRARKQLRILKEETKAATVIQQHIRGYLVRVWFRKTMQEIRAATMIQALVRGFVQRKKFEKILENHRLEENQREIIENFANLIQKLKDNSMMQPISFSVEEHVETIDMKRRKMDEQTRRERSLQMRELYAERQNKWEMFRQAEKQRRIDKAQQEKMDYMNGILQGKDERRQYHIEQFQYTNNVRSHFQAASIIQKAYRQYRERKNWWKRVKEAGLARDRAKKSFAAGVIQCSWRKHKDWKKFEATYMCSVHTNPVVQLSKRPLFELASDKGLKSYERSTLTSGIGRRKLHQTKSGGFKIFRPLPTVPADVIYTNFSPLKHQPAAAITVGNSGCIKKRTRANKMETMKVHWPWVKHLLEEENAYGGTNKRSSSGAAVYSSHGAAPDKLKLPQIH